MGSFGRAVDVRAGQACSVRFILRAAASAPSRDTPDDASLCSARVHFRSVPLNPDLLGSAPSDFFQLLNLELDASQEDIRSSYRGLQVRTNQHQHEHLQRLSSLCMCICALAPMLVRTDSQDCLKPTPPSFQ